VYGTASGEGGGEDLATVALDGPGDTKALGVGGLDGAGNSGVGARLLRAAAVLGPGVGNCGGLRGGWEGSVDWGVVPFAFAAAFLAFLARARLSFSPVRRLALFSGSFFRES